MKIRQQRAMVPKKTMPWLRTSQRLASFLILLLATVLLCVTSAPVLATLSAINTSTQPSFKSTQIDPAAPMEGGRTQYERGHFEAALKLWEDAEAFYTKKSDRTGVIQSRINQAQALKAQGAYPRASEILCDLDNAVPANPPSVEKAQILRSLGDAYQNAYRSQDDLKRADVKLKQSLEIAKSLKSIPETRAAYLSLGVAARSNISHVSPEELKLNPGSEVTKVIIDLALQRQGQLQDALSILQLAINDKVTEGSYNTNVTPSIPLCDTGERFDPPHPPLPKGDKVASTAQKIGLTAQAESAQLRATALQAQLNQLGLLVNTLPRFNSFLAKALESFVEDKTLQSYPSYFLSSFLNQPALAAQLFPVPTKPEKPSPRITKLAALTTKTAKLIEKLQQTLSEIALQPVSPSPTLAAVNAQINLAQNLVRLTRVANSAADVDQKMQTIFEQILEEGRQKSVAEKLNHLKTTEVTFFLSAHARLNLQTAVQKSSKQAAEILGQAVKAAQAIHNERAEASARAALAELYASVAVSKQQWAEVETLSQQAIALAQAGNAPEIAYRLHWQLARSLYHQDRTPAARAACQVAAKTLQSLRSDLVAINQDVQFTFQESIEPFYRECAMVLLPTSQEEKDLNQKPVQDNLETARNLIESLQLAELDNFFREACIEGRKVPIDQIVGDKEDRRTAVIYPIIISDPQPGSQQRLVVMAKLPNQSQLHYHPVNLYANEKVDETLANLRAGLTDPTKANLAMQAGKRIYQWLMTPLEPELHESKLDDKVDTLVFVLNGAFQNVPMAALYNESTNRYLLEDYAIAVSPGLQLFAPKTTSQEKPNILAAGLIDFPLKYGLDKLSDQDFQYMEKEKVLIKPQLLEADFTSENLSRQMNTGPFNIVHLSTHAGFGSRKENTYVLMAEGKVDVDRLSEIFQNRTRNKTEPIDLLFLSACETAKNDNRAVLGLAGIALKTGVRSTLASLWSVDSSATSQFVDNFYKELIKKNQTKAKAVQMAQIELKNTFGPDPSKWASKWAPFVLVGNWL